jgi:hypothetical protein
MPAIAQFYGAETPARLKIVAAALLIVGAMAAVVPPPGRAATPQNFQVATTADYLALCSTAQGQDNYVAAIHFCEGFETGAYQYYLALAAKDPAERFVCLPSPSPSRDKVKADFVAWAKANPAVMNDQPVDSMFRYLGQTYPCAPGQK